jgi:hypothetical protein
MRELRLADQALPDSVIAARETVWCAGPNRRRRNQAGGRIADTR